MPPRLKVLISAYACEPGKGSEPEVGWQWSLQMARFHDVVVLTRENNRTNIEAELERLGNRQPVPVFHYHDQPRWQLDFKRRFKVVQWYYLLWQRSARDIVAELHRKHRFDLMHHVTFAGYRYPAAIWGHGVPTIWGPVGGIESVPTALLPWLHPRSLAAECGRNLHNLIQVAPFNILAKRAAATTVLLASTPEMQRGFARLGFAAQLMPTIGLDTRSLSLGARAPQQGPLRLLFVGNIITLKGVDLALQALKQSQTQATLTLIGAGNYLPAAKVLTRQLGLEDRVHFRGRMPRQEVLDAYREFDVFLFPSLHDTGGYAVIEAMWNELPVICLDCGGPSVAVAENCGRRIPIESRPQVITQLAATIRNYDQHRTLVTEHGKAARVSIRQNYDWEQKGERMNKVYEQAAAHQLNPSPRAAAPSSYSGLGGTAHLLHSLVSYRGLLVTLVGLLLIGMVGFASLSWLRQEANRIVADTLPGLAYAGAANAYLADPSRTLLCAVTDDAEKRKQLHEEINALSTQTEVNLALYQKYIFEEEDKTNFDRVIQTRRKYLLIRDEVLALADAGEHQQALAKYNQLLLPAHRDVKTAGDKLLEYNIRMGEVHSKRITMICTITQVVVAGGLVLIFVLGFLFGLSR